MEHIIKILEEIENKPKYTNLFTPKIPYLEQDMENQRIKKIVIPMLPIIEKEIDDLIFNKIKSSKDVKSADVYFNILLEIQSILSRLLIVEEIPLSEKLTDFTIDFEPIYDEWVRQEIFNRVKQGIYNYDFNESYRGE